MWAAADAAEVKGETWDCMGSSVKVARGDAAGGLVLAFVLAAMALLAATAGSASGASLASAWGLNDDGQLGNGSTTGPESAGERAQRSHGHLGRVRAQSRPSRNRRGEVVGLKKPRRPRQGQTRSRAGTGQW